MASIKIETVKVERQNLAWSDKQKAIFQLVKEGEKNIAIEACAGGAKTTTIIEAMNYLPSNKRAIFVAFNKSIADTLGSKVPENATAATLHSVAYQAMKQLGWSKVNARKTSNILQYELINQNDEEQVKWFWDNQKDICRLISIAKGSLRTYTQEELFTAAYDMGVEPSFYLDSFLYPAYEKSCFFKAGEKGHCIIDYDDMLRIPLLQECNFPTYDYVFIDEAQDLNEIQRLICERLLAAGGRLVAVGDRKQAIYGFRGADYNSFDLMKEHFSCISMPLDTSYRCSKAVVGEANKLYTDIYALPTATEGEVGMMPEYSLPIEARAGDMVLCRLNYPLISQAMSCIAQGKPVAVISSDLPATVLKYGKQCIRWGRSNYNKLTDALHSDLIDKYFKSLLTEPNITKGRTAFLLDLKDTMLFLLEPGFTTKEQLEKRLDTMFTPDLPTDGKYIIFSSIHRAKGLEANRVFILSPENLPHYLATTPQELLQEKNLHYVAITRAKKELIYVVQNMSETLCFDYSGGGEFSRSVYNYPRFLGVVESKLNDSLSFLDKV